MSFTSTPLYGGAITANIPSLLKDASTIRPVPDTQEVFVSTNPATDLSVIIDLLSAVEPSIASTPEAVAEYHFRDALEEADHPVDIAKIEEVPTAIEGVRAVGVVGRVKNRGEGWTVVWMTVMRLETVGTDLVVSVNVPEEEGLDDGTAVRNEVVGSLRVVDWGLFVQE